MERILKTWLAGVVALCLLMGIGACGEAENPGGGAAREVVEALFAAAAGTSFDAEQNLRAELSGEACRERSAALMDYRAKTLPWLCAALGQAATDARTLADGYAAMQGCDAGRAYLELLEELGFAGAQACMEGTVRACQSWLGEIDHAALEKINPDYVCWLYCPDSPIDYPVVQGADNAAYLHRLFNGESNACGTLFIDCRNLADFQDPNTLIYGHHMRNGSMFKSISYYADQAWYDAHPFMLIASGREIAVLELFAGCTTSKRDPCYEVALSDANDLLALEEELKGKSDFASGVKIEPGDRLVTLSTCAYAFEGARYIAVGRLRSVRTAEEM